jgi:uncharacterized membrane protein
VIAPVGVSGADVESSETVRVRTAHGKRTRTDVFEIPAGDGGSAEHNTHEEHTGGGDTFQPKKKKKKTPK